MSSACHDVEVTLYVYQRPHPWGREPSPENFYVSTIDQHDPTLPAGCTMAEWVLVATHTVLLPNVPLLDKDAFAAVQQAQQDAKRQARIDALTAELEKLTRAP